jgi:MFS family permease
LTYRELLTRYPDFRRLWTGQVVSEIGDWLNNIAVFALVIEIAGRGHEGVAVALYGLARHLPLFFFGPLAGVVTDRVSRRRVMIVADVLRAILTLGFFVGDAYRSLYLLYVVGALLFAVTPFFNAAKRASLPALVTEPGALLAANSLSASTTAATIALGSALGGILATFGGRGTVFTLNIITFILSALLIRRITLTLDAKPSFVETEVSDLPHIEGETSASTLENVCAASYNEPQKASPRERASSFRLLLKRSYEDFREGLAYVRADAVLALVFVVAAGWGLGNGAARAVYSIFGARLGEGAAGASLLQGGRAEDFGISVLFVAMGLGGVLGAPLARLINRHETSGLGARMAFALVVDGCLLVVFSFMPNLWSAGGVLLLREMCFAVWWTSQQTLIMRGARRDFAGRVFASFETLTTLAMVASMLISGAAADRFGMRPVVAIGGTVVALSGASWFLLRRKRGEGVRSANDLIA